MKGWWLALLSGALVVAGCASATVGNGVDLSPVGMPAANDLAMSPAANDLAMSSADASVVVDAAVADAAVVDAATVDLRCSGVCTPGATQAGSCDPCSQQTCGSDCMWGACTLKAGNACEWKSGNNPRACSTCVSCSGTPRQWCLSSCQWSTLCACCGATSCVNC